VKQHPTTVVSAEANIADDVVIGPFSIVESCVEIGSCSVLRSHVVIHAGTTIGKNNIFHQGCAIGDFPQDLSYQEEPTKVEIGDDNIFREFVTVNRGTAKDRGLTTIGSNCFLMAYSHVGHDCLVGDHVVLTNCSSLAGHATLQDHVMLSGYVGIHQHCTVGKYSFVGALTIVNKDVVPFSMIVPDGANRSTVNGMNLVGLKRAGYSIAERKQIKAAHKFLFNSGLNTTQALEAIQKEGEISAPVIEIIDFVKSSKRGISK
jgi:UDP-N-acetylglucosamine acyltransferase